MSLRNARTNFTALLLLLATPAIAADPADQPTDQPTEPPAELTADRTEPTALFRALATFSDKIDVDTGPGELAISRVGADVDVRFDLGEGKRLTLGANALHSWYDFDGATGLIAGTGEPFERVIETNLTARYFAPANDKTSWFVLGSVGIAAEDGADIGESIVGLAGGGFVTNVSETFSWGLGVAVLTRLEDDVLVVPLPQIRLVMSDRWTLASERAGAKLSYKASETLTASFSARYESHSFRLDEDGLLPDGMATEAGVPLVFELAYSPSPTVEVIGQVGAAVGRSIEVLDTNGNEISDNDFDSGVFAGVGVRIRF